MDAEQTRAERARELAAWFAAQDDALMARIADVLNEEAEDDEAMPEVPVFALPGFRAAPAVNDNSRVLRRTRH